MIPVRHTCDGRNVSPPLRWAAPPTDTRSFALLMDDPDAPGGTFTHWIAWNIPAGTRSLRSGQRPPREGTNDAGRIGYTGPCPPSGVHRYVFRLYALNSNLGVPRGASRAEFLAALRGKVLATARLVGRYRR
jgi:Raf kinase inhibitor-like YbhB/YbcL family protein